MIIFTIEESPPVEFGIAVHEEIEIEAEPVVYVNINDPYPGPYEFTPAAAAQTIEISGLMATADITINPIPSNYGLITWNGATLTVL